MNLNQLKYFYVVCECGSLSDASAFLYISQPSLSAAIKALEEEFGVSLFTRHHQGMVLTKEGKILYEMCQDILARTEQLESIMKDLGNNRHKLRLGIPPMIGSLILPFIYCGFCQKHPDITLEIVEVGRGELLDKLSKSYLDMVFLLQNKPLDAKYETIKLTQSELLCCVSNNNILAKQSSISPTDLKETALVLYENSFFQTEEIKSWFSQENVNCNIILQTNQLSSMLSMISNNVAVGFTLKELAETYQDFTAIPTKNPIYVDVSLVWKKDSYKFTSMEKFKNYVIENNPFTRIEKSSK